MTNQLKEQFSSTESFISLALGLAVVVAVGMLVFNFIQSTGDISEELDSGTGTTEETSMETSTPGGTHVVAEGETLWDIAEKYYSSGYNWVDIQEANNLTDGDDIEAGEELSIPVTEPMTTTTGEVSSAQIESQYTVKPGDSLWTIAVSAYGDGYRWVDIAQANNLVNPDVIHTGNVLQMPQ